MAGRPLELWYPVSAVAVMAPNTPSAPPRTVMPAAMSARWRILTFSPRAPMVIPENEGFAVGAAVGVVVAGAGVAVGAAPSFRREDVAASTSPVTGSPFQRW